jgi:hypothetical protein
MVGETIDRFSTVRSNRARHRLAVVDVERAAIRQRHVEVVRAAEDMVPRQPVDQHRGAVLHEGQRVGELRLVHAHHRCVVSTPLGAEVEPEVIRILPTVSGRPRHGRRRRRPRIALHQVFEGCDVAASAGPRGDDLDPVQRIERQRLGVLPGVDV